MRTRDVLGLLILGALLAGAAVLTASLRASLLAVPAQAQGGASAELDMDPGNGSGPCNPVDATRAVNVGDTFEVAVCLTDAPLSPAAFQFNLLYDNTVDQCVPVDCGGERCLDGNPDANAGGTTWGGTSLGEGWDCNVLSTAPPVCDKSVVGSGGGGVAFLQCLSTIPPTLNVGEGVSVPIAVVTFKPIATGTDTFKLDQVEIDKASGMPMVNCEDIGLCSGGSVTIAAAGAPTATAASGPDSAATAAAATAVAQGTPLAAIDEAATATTAAVATAAAATAVAKGTPIAAVNQAAAATSAAAATKAASGGKVTPKPTTTGESGGSSGPNAGIIAGGVIAAIIIVGGAGWFALRRLRAG